MKLIVGLGNPGKTYALTRHNVGFIVIDNYLKGEKYANKFNGEYLIKNIGNTQVCFVKPQTYMNLSGDCVSKFMQYYKIDNKDCLVVHDDLDLPIMSYRIKFDSSSGGHNGIKSIINMLSTQSFCRLKIGIGSSNNDTKDHVLGKLSKDEILYLDNDIFKNIIDEFINNDIESVMNKFQGK